MSSASNQPDEPRDDGKRERSGPEHEFGTHGAAPNGGWKTWLDVPLVLKATDVMVLLNVSRSTAYAAMRDGSVPSFRVRNTRRCLRIVVWAIANGKDPSGYVGRYPFDDGGTGDVA